MPYSTKCTTVLSNFEANQNYKDTVDPSIIVRFPLVEDESVVLLAWTTTPWTLPSNLALAVNADFDYIKFKDKKTEKVYIVALCRI
jgi:isoleucyl-tRNA synthetase